MARVETVHRNVDGRQRTTKRVVLQDATGEEHVHEFEGPPGGELEEYEFAGDGDPSDRALEELASHFGEDVVDEE